ncbi:MAG: hypothetical protein DLM69_10435, partial [Candidatus Chloroheliales bacterium]
MRKVSNRYARLLVVAVLGALLVSAGLSFYGNLTGSSSSKPVALVSGDKDAPAKDVIQPGENPADEGNHLNSIEDYWNSRVTYPTGQFNHAWVEQAAVQDSQIARAVPAGRVTYNHANSSSPLNLNPN